MQSLAKDSVRSLLIPLQGVNLLLPNVAVAEVVPYIHPRAVDGAPEWMLGTINWRGLNIPLISYERLYGVSEADQGKARIAVFNTVDRKHGIKFYAIVTAGIPQLNRVSEDMIHQEAEVPDGSVCELQIAGIAARIPDLNVLESAVAEVWNQVA